MSHILDALQKVQDEKTAKLKQSTITGGVLLDTPQTRKPRSNRFLLAGIAVAVLLTGILIARTLLKPTVTPAVMPPVAVTPLQPEQAPPLQSAPPPSVSLPPQTTGLAAPPAPKRPASTAPKTTGQQPAQDAEKAADLRAQKRIQTSIGTPPPPATTTVTVLNSAPDGVKLTGIAWQDSKKLRRVVVNDTLVGEGAVIAGARIVEIKPTVVRFEKGGTFFEVGLSR